MLTAGERGERVGWNVVFGPRARKRMEDPEVGHSALDSELPRGLDRGGPVERADRNRDVIAALDGIGQRRPAIAAEPPLGGLRALEHAGLAARPIEVLIFHAHQGSEERPERLLAHAAMTDMRIIGFAVDRVADGAALTSAGEPGFASHGQVSVW